MRGSVECHPERHSPRVVEERGRLETNEEQAETALGMQGWEKCNSVVFRKVIMSVNFTLRNLKVFLGYSLPPSEALVRIFLLEVVLHQDFLGLKRYHVTNET